MSLELGMRLRQLRKSQGLSQQKLGDALELKRSVIASYEEGRAEPRIATLAKIADHFRLTIDQFLNEDHTSSSGRIPGVLAITVDPEGNENIELVNEKASASYLTGYSDPEYVAELPRFRLPMLPEGTHRAFKVSGDSMLPIQPGSIVVGKYSDNWEAIREGSVCIVVSQKEGVVLKRLYNLSDPGKGFRLVSDNPVYPSFELALDEISEIWLARMLISDQFPQPEMTLERLTGVVMRLESELSKMKHK